MKTNTMILSALLLVAPVALAAADLWDMTEVRQQPLEVERLGAPRKAPLVVAGAGDWMSTGDGWVAGKKAAPAPTATKPAAGDEQLLVEELFISSEHTPAGPNRIFCAVARPEKTSGPVPVVLIFHGGGGHASGALALAAARRHPGMAGVAMDYNGQFMPGPKGKVTQWKNVSRDRKFDLVPNLQNWPMWHNVIAARRTIDFLETQPWADKNRIGAVGISYGGWVALLLAGVDERVKCVTTGVSAGGAGVTSGRSAQQLRWEPAEQRALWLAHYEPLAHAPSTKAAVFFQLAANDLFFWLNGAAKNLEALPGEKGWVLRPNSNHGAGGPEVPDTAAPAFMRHVLLGAPALPQVSALQVSDDGLRYSWKANGPRALTRAVLNWSPGKAVSPGRYWIEFPATHAGDTWSAQVPADFGKCAAQAFVNLGDERGLVVSSVLLVRDGLDPLTAAGPQWSGGQLWDVERGAAAWRTPAGWLPKTVFEFVSPTGLKLGPDKGGKDFALVSNSAILASGVAAQHQGLHLRVNGNGAAGTLKVTLLRDTNSLDERAYTAEIKYPADASEHDLSWSAFKLTTKNVTAPPLPCPFDGVMFSGARENGQPLSIEAVKLVR
jgi:dienelactone hydrolase